MKTYFREILGRKCEQNGSGQNPIADFPEHGNGYVSSWKVEN
jgi:hypothetical protein